MSSWLEACAVQTAVVHSPPSFVYIRTEVRTSEIKSQISVQKKVRKYQVRKDHVNKRRARMPDPHRLSVSSSVSNASVDTLPRPVTSKTCMSAAVKRWRYLRRLFHYKQMDFEFAFWQMVYLISNPKVVYKNFTYRKQTKAQFARDDPAFLVLLAGWLVISS